MRMEECLDAIEGCRGIAELQSKLQAIVGHYGFHSFTFIEITDPGDRSPLVITTVDQAWVDDYRSHGFVEVDPVLPLVRRSNTPFTWADVPLPLRLGRRKSGALRTMEAARDHGLVEGLVVPVHGVDRLGRARSASCVLFWKDRLPLFRRVPRQHRSELHVVMVYWAQRAFELLAEAAARPTPEAEGVVQLSDRERAALGWAARGKTMAETGVILSISTDTVETHLRNAMAKLNAVNKTQAAVLALKLGLIDV